MSRFTVFFYLPAGILMAALFPALMLGCALPGDTIGAQPPRAGTRGLV
jgi:hypothetical protein